MGARHVDTLLVCWRGRCPRVKLYSAAALAAVAAAAFGFFRLLTMIVISGTSSIGKRAVQGMMDHAGELRLHGPRLDLQRIDGGVVNFIREFEFATGRRPGRRSRTE